MLGAIRFNPNVSGISSKYNYEIPAIAKEFVSGAVNPGTYNLNHPKTADDEGLRMLGTSASVVGNRLDIQC